MHRVQNVWIINDLCSICTFHLYNIRVITSRIFLIKKIHSIYLLTLLWYLNIFIFSVFQDCIELAKQYQPYYSPPLFNHIGKYSSLEGKISKERILSKNFPKKRKKWVNILMIIFYLISTAIVLYIGTHSMAEVFPALKTPYFGKKKNSKWPFQSPFF